MARSFPLEAEKERNWGVTIAATRWDPESDGPDSSIIEIKPDDREGRGELTCVAVSIAIEPSHWVTANAGPHKRLIWSEHLLGQRGYSRSTLCQGPP